VGEASVTVVDAMVGGFTMRSADAALLSIRALMLAEPGLLAVTSPLLVTLATPLLSDAQFTNRPVRILPPASLAIAVACVVAPTLRNWASNETVTLATEGSETVMIDVPTMVSLVATMLASPGAIAVTNPTDETVTMLALLVDQLIVRPLSTPPEASLVVAVALVVSPMRRVVLPTATLTLATGAGPAAPPPPPQANAARQQAMTTGRERFNLGREGGNQYWGDVR
jgi:hypothetical protein